ncbi:hypothetical protein GYMLUDRAFT_72080 [Collybiopsis luxurians FD-317 M1]|uniref:F-box domain-containing protein n=1 Tax=Collybiopsis luxurians FD-317 M1 TaxID=944289 RepID=A0A0D0BHB9_9AGAR|nr:hypothetical protein GYMLUDRAFT_72080 [Collybiopsis luxurians FD-317 M1]
MTMFIPNEILILILEVLSESGDTPALKACSLVSTTWHTIAATFLFSSLDLLCSMGELNVHASPASPQPKPKRYLELALGVFPVYKKRLSSDPEMDCTCERYKDRAIQLFHSRNASSSPHIIRNVVQLKLIFCWSDSWSDPCCNGPHSLQLFPDPQIASVFKLVDELSFVHLRFLVLDYAPQVLYYLTFDPFNGLLSSSARSLEEITFNSGSVSMQSQDVKRTLTKHAFSSTRFPRLRRLVFQGLGNYVRKMSIALELRRLSTVGMTPSITVRAAYSFHQDALNHPDGFAEFEIPHWCCFSGHCSRSIDSDEHHSLADAMSLGTGFIDWTFPTVGIVLRSLQSDTLGQFARSLNVRLSPDSNDPAGIKILEYLTQTFPQISSLNLCFDSLIDMKSILLDHPEVQERSSVRRTISQHLAQLSEVHTLRFTLTNTAAATLTFEPCLVEHATEITEYVTVQRIIRRLFSALDTLFVDLYRDRRDFAHSQGLRVVFQVDTSPDSTGEAISTPTIDESRVQHELELMFPKAKALDPGFLTVRVARLGR